MDDDERCALCGDTRSPHTCVVPWRRHWAVLPNSLREGAVAVWLEANEWTHLTMVSIPSYASTDTTSLPDAFMPHTTSQPDAFMPTPWAICRSTRGQIRCSCGRYRLEWT